MVKFSITFDDGFDHMIIYELIWTFTVIAMVQIAVELWIGF